MSATTKTFKTVTGLQGVKAFKATTALRTGWHVLTDTENLGYEADKNVYQIMAEHPGKILKGWTGNGIHIG
jgi:hypothetical protein